MCLCACVGSNNKDMKQLINLLNTTLQCQPRQAPPGRPDSASDRVLSAVAAADDDISDVAVIPPQRSKPNLGVTFVKASSSVISAPRDPRVKQSSDAVDGICPAAEPAFQLGMSLLAVAG